MCEAWRIRKEPSISSHRPRLITFASSIIFILSLTAAALHLVTKMTYAFPSGPNTYASGPVPAWDEWQTLWKLWDVVTRKMLPEEELRSKPIKLRNACIFYLGHIPTFLDMKVSEALGAPLTEPEYYSKIFERGIDPDVDNPQHCHAHSAIPDDWPPLEEMLDYQVRIRQRMRSLYDSGAAYEDMNAGRALWLGFEHEAMHLETLLYMLLQSDKTVPPPDLTRPDFETLAKKAEMEAVENEWFTIPTNDIVLGLDDPENAGGPRRYFGWDIEKPARTTTVHSFQAKARPITNGEYLTYLTDKGLTSIPASWTETSYTNGNTNGTTTTPSLIDTTAVRTIFGPVPLKLAMHWPISASFDEVTACAAYMGGRIPTLEEARNIYMYAAQRKAKEAENALGRRIPAVNGHLVNDGVEETPPSKCASNGAATGSVNGEKGDVDAYAMHCDLDRCNVGFKNWHPTPVTQHGNQLIGQGGMGGLWEWTSSTLEKHDGYKPMPLYPAYSRRYQSCNLTLTNTTIEDFFDEKHNVVVGGSWATVPRIAGRKTFVNWYQVFDPSCSL